MQIPQEEIRGFKIVMPKDFKAEFLEKVVQSTKRPFDMAFYRFPLEV